MSNTPNDGDISGDERIRSIEEIKAAFGPGGLAAHAEAKTSNNPIYSLPLANNEEFERLNKQGFLVRLAMWALVPLRNDIAEVLKVTAADAGQKSILDVGCGPGEWYAPATLKGSVSDFHRALAMSEDHPQTRIVGIDQAPQMPDKLPANVEFQLHDANQGLQPYYGAFDIVHARFIGGGITSYRAFIQEASKCVKPGGLAIFLEGNFDLVKEDQRTIQEPASDSNPNGSWLQRWLQAVRMAQVRRCGLKDPDDSPEALDRGLWQFGLYDPASTHAASVFTPVTPWPKSTFEEEALHFKVTGTLMRQNMKVFLLSTEQLLIEDGHTKDELSKWRSHIRKEIQGEGRFKLWYAWRAAWGRMPGAASTISANGVRPSASPEPAQGRTVPLEQEQLVSKLPQFTLPQCVIRNEQEALAYVEHRINEPFSTRECF